MVVDMKKVVKFKKLVADAIIPDYAHEGDAGAERRGAAGSDRQVHRPAHVCCVRGYLPRRDAGEAA